MLEDITYRQLNYCECERIREIDASQYIGRTYREVNGIRQLVEINYQDPDFPEGYENHLQRLKSTVKSGGSALGAFLNEKLIGFCSINPETFGERHKYVLLDQLFISLNYRSKGIGKQLFFRSAIEAEKFGAEKLYICAGSAEETIGFYKALGCVKAVEINRELYSNDVRDMQLEYSLIKKEGHKNEFKQILTPPVFIRAYAD